MAVWPVRMMVAAACAALAGCTPQPPLPGVQPVQTQTPAPELPTSWTIIAVNGRPIDAAASRVRPSLEINGEAVSGHAGCNRFFGRLRSGTNTTASPGTSGPQTWLEGPVATTRMACEPAAMTVERSITAALAQAVSLRRSDTGARLMDRSGATLIDLVPASVAAAPPALAGTVWQLVRAGTAMIDANRRPTLIVDGDRVSGNAGCNQFGGTLTVNGHQFIATAGPMTMMACADDAQNAVEAAYMRALWGSGTWTVTGRTLTLSGTHGQLVFEAR
jgi:heat shock protein HslJ